MSPTISELSFDLPSSVFWRRVSSSYVCSLLHLRLRNGDRKGDNFLGCWRLILATNFAGDTTACWQLWTMGTSVHLCSLTGAIKTTVAKGTPPQSGLSIVWWCFASTTISCLDLDSMFPWHIAGSMPNQPSCSAKHLVWDRNKIFAWFQWQTRVRQMTQWQTCQLSMNDADADTHTNIYSDTDSV